MKKLILLTMFMIVSLLSYSQTKTFSVVSNGNVLAEDVSKYELVIKNANMEAYRNKTTRSTIIFDNGFKVELLSAQELVILGVEINVSGYSDIRDPRYTQPTFHLVDNVGIPQAPGQEPYLIALYNHIEK